MPMISKPMNLRKFARRAGMVALVLVAALATIVGRSLVRRVPLHLVHGLAGVVFAVFAAIAAVAAAVG